MADTLLTNTFSEPLNGETTAKFNIHAGDGNLIIEPLSGSEPVLASGTLQYFEKQGLPARNLISQGDQVTFSLRGGADNRPRFRLPWAACNGATEWQVQLNPMLSSDITAHSDGGNVKLNLAGMVVTRVSADTGGGNLEVVLPDEASNLNVFAKSGAGNVVVVIPNDMSARIQATTGLGKVIIDPRFTMIDKNTYQSSDFDHAAHKAEITLHSGAGNVSVGAR